MDAGIIGGIVGTILGLAGGIIGTYFSIKNTKGPLERAFMIKASLIAWIAITAFLVLIFLLPNPYRFLLWIPYGILLPFGISKINKRVAEIREIESAN
ncbi:MAG: hypothetical protein DWP95_08125 [Proteobacteria bacterium]|nr:MAG: hypothetical protein DWP95_08125 [Pseudomonadota bacterium]